MDAMAIFANNVNSRTLSAPAMKRWQLWGIIFAIVIALSIHLRIIYM